MSFKISNSTEYFNVLNSSKVETQNVYANEINSNNLTVSEDSSLNGGLSNNNIISSVSVFFEGDDISDSLGAIISNGGLLSGSLQIPFIDSVTAPVTPGDNYVDIVFTDTSHTFLNTSDNYSIITTFGFQVTAVDPYSSLPSNVITLYGDIVSNNTLRIYISPYASYLFVAGNVISINYLITKIN